MQEFTFSLPLFHRSLRPDCSLTYAGDLLALGEDVAQKWAKDGCGVASVSAVVESLCRLKDASVRLPSVTQLCERYRADAYLPGIGWIHKGLVCLASDFGIEAFNEPSIPLEKLCALMQEGWIPVISVTMGFKGGEPYIAENGEARLRQPGGHLVVVTGFDMGKGVWVKDCQNPMLRDEDETAEWVVWERVLASFSGKAIFFKTP